MASASESLRSSSSCSEGCSTSGLPVSEAAISGDGEPNEVVSSVAIDVREVREELTPLRTANEEQPAEPETAAPALQEPEQESALLDRIHKMTDVAHELGALRLIVDSPLSSKVALFNQTAKSHRESQLSNPFSDAQATRGMARLQISKEEYGKPKAGSLTEYRGKKANIQVYQEMLELCQVIDCDGQPVSKKNPDIKMIYFGELFNIYTHINDKLVGLLLRARKHDLIQFEGECLFQRRDDHVPVYLTKPIAQIRDILVGKQTEIRRSLSPNPQPTNMLP
uniref:Costars domain-containing protein n=1 Tax=Anopheles farauti TaxID=69004 RepID=A0A182QGV7_9DIPT